MAYNLQNIRALLTEGFDIDDLRRFCFDHFDFKTVYHRLSPEMGKDKVIDQLLEYAEQTLHYEPLLNWAKEQNPIRYQQHGPYHLDSPILEPPLPSPVRPRSPKQNERTRPRIFLCHAREDKPRVMELYRQLKESGYHPWLDKFDLLPGQDWRREIEKIIRDPYNLILVCLSNNSVTKRGVVQQEIKWALDILDQTPEGTIYLIPVRLGECEAPERLSELHWVNLFEPDGFEYLKRALDYEIGKRQPQAEPAPIIPTKTPTKPATEQKPEKEEDLPPSYHLQGVFVGQYSSPEYHEPGTLVTGPDLENAKKRGGDPVLEGPHLKTSAQPKRTKQVKRIAKKPELFEPELILIPAGEFLMGSDPTKDKVAEKNEQPQHRLYLPDYYIAKTPVTNIQYSIFIKATGRETSQHWTDGQPPRNRENHPVVNVTWHEAICYCHWLTELTDQNYTLPSEAEWEKAARGTEGFIYPWGNQWDSRRCNNRERGPEDTTPVGTYSGGVSWYGLLDMAGNVWEWTRSLWGDDEQEPKFGYPYRFGDGRENVRASDKIRRVLRGGSFDNSSREIRCTYRSVNNYPYEWGPVIGFRVAVSSIE